MKVVPQFGSKEAGRDYKDRPAVFGLAARNGQIAVVQVEKPGHPAWLDLPGGAIDPGESAVEALVREFGEETGLRVTAGPSFARADQYFLNTDGKAFNNRASFHVVDVLDKAPDLKIEDDHVLDWITPLEAVTRLRHDAHSWAVSAWLRRAAKDAAP